MQQTKQTMELTPQARTVLAHLTKHKSLTQAEAGTVYRIRALPRRIADLKEAGYKIRSEHKKDATGQRYVRYFLEDYESPEAEPYVKTGEETPAKPEVETPVLREGVRVRVVDARGVNSCFYSVGDTGTVERDDKDGTFLVQFDAPVKCGDGRWWVESELVDVIGTSVEETPEQETKAAAPTLRVGATIRIESAWLEDGYTNGDELTVVEVEDGEDCWVEVAGGKRRFIAAREFEVIA